MVKHSEADPGKKYEKPGLNLQVAIGRNTNNPIMPTQLSVYIQQRQTDKKQSLFIIGFRLDVGCCLFRQPANGTERN